MELNVILTSNLSILVEMTCHNLYYVVQQIRVNFRVLSVVLQNQTKTKKQNKKERKDPKTDPVA